MRAYLAIITDSLREATTSRVCWILLGLITSLLLAIAPLGFHQKLTSGISKADIIDWNLLVVRIGRDAKGGAPSPGRRVWKLLDKQARNTISEFLHIAENRPGMALNERGIDSLFYPAFRDVVTRRDLYDEAAWKDISKGSELRALVRQSVEELSDIEVGRRNRLLFEAAFPQVVRRSPATSIQLNFLGWPMTDPLPIRKDQLADQIAVGLSVLMRVFVGFVAVFLGILVTSTIIPQTFHSGSISLLLSKPISRSLLFLTKFIGGCTFIVLSTSYLIGGLWLLAGWRFGVWNHRLLLCAPIFLFLFMIYYSVSALAGVVWKSAVVSVIMAALLWLACFVVSLTKHGVEVVFIHPHQIMKLVPAGDTLVAINRADLVNRWDEPTGSWRPVFSTGKDLGTLEVLQQRPDLLGPVYDSERDQLLAIPMSYGGVLPIQSSLWISGAEDGWKRESTSNVPYGPLALLNEPDGHVIVVTGQHIYRLTGDPRTEGNPPSIFGIDLPTLKSGPFTPVGPEVSLDLKPLSAIAMNHQSGQLAVIDSGKLTLLEPDDDGMYTRVVEKDLEGINEEVLLAFGGPRLSIARADGTFSILDATTLEVQHELRPEGGNQPRFVEASPTGRWFSVLYQHERLVLIDAAQGKVVRHRFTGQGDISASRFLPDNTLLVADHATRVSRYQLDPFRRAHMHSDRIGMIEQSYYYMFNPLYKFLPKPGKLNNTAMYLLSGKESFGGSSLRSEHSQLDPWNPVWSSLVFVVAVLGLSCWYIERSEF